MKIKKPLVLAIFAIAIVGIIAPTNASNIDKNAKIESKAKTASYKITWNANGGKIGTKKIVSTAVKQNTKIGKLPTTPKRTGYSFQGWYTKKAGGTKITKNTVVKKKVTYYAHWKNRVLNTEEKKLVGMWKEGHNTGAYTFYNDGTYISFSNPRLAYSNPNPSYSGAAYQFKGFYSLKNGILSLKSQARLDYGSGWGSWGNWEKNEYHIQFEDSSYAIGGGLHFTLYEGSPSFYKQ